MKGLAELVVELLKKLRPAYSAPLVLLVLFSWWRIRAFEEVRLRDIPTDPWILIAGGAVALWFAGVFFLNWRWFDPASPTPEGKVGFFVARVENDPGNKKQNGMMALLHEAFSKKPDLADLMYVGDLRVGLPHGSADAQALSAQKPGRKAKAARVVWIVEGERKGERFEYHTAIQTAAEGAFTPKATPVPWMNFRRVRPRFGRSQP